jgi:hypothetical protein
MEVMQISKEDSVASSSFQNHSYINKEGFSVKLVTIVQSALIKPCACHYSSPEACIKHLLKSLYQPSIVVVGRGEREKQRAENGCSSQVYLTA